MRPTQLTWIANTGVSFLHTAEALALNRPVVDAALAEALRPAAENLHRTLVSCGVEAQAFFAQAAPLAYQEPGDRRLAEVSLRKAIGPRADERIVSLVAHALTGFKQIAAKNQPKLLDELTLRSGPIREQWETRGPGLIAGVGRRTDPDVLVETGTVFVVYPVCGGGGIAHPPSNSVRLEAVLANPWTELPEVVRLAWLVTTLNTDLPRFNEQLVSPRRQEVPLLALIPAILEAAADVELVRPQPGLLVTALQRWGWTAEEAERLAPPIEQWWQTYQELRPAWPVALKALEQLAFTE